ncbi:hypothetical protein ANAPC5_01327 [Anaplasma phagocytophilum]|nr:hypothetical protein ANAPC5_01327 [Anaplasma phagocytophilum]
MCLVVERVLMQGSWFNNQSLPQPALIWMSIVPALSGTYYYEVHVKLPRLAVVLHWLNFSSTVVKTVAVLCQIKLLLSKQLRTIFLAAVDIEHSPDSFGTDKCVVRRRLYVAFTTVCAVNNM